MSKRCRFVLWAVVGMHMLMSCSPWTFTIQQHTGWPLQGRIYTRHDLVDVEAANTIMVSHPSSVALRCEQVTEGIFDTEVTVTGPLNDTADVLTLRLRSTPHADTVHDAKAPVEIRITPHVTTVVTPTSTRTVQTPLPSIGTPFRIHVITFGRTMRVSVACHDVGTYAVEVPSSEWISITPGLGTTLRFADPMILPPGYADRWDVTPAAPL